MLYFIRKNSGPKSLYIINILLLLKNIFYFVHNINLSYLFIIKSSLDLY